jgi:hypothetical protein
VRSDEVGDEVRRGERVREWGRDSDLVLEPELDIDLDRLLRREREAYSLFEAAALGLLVTS